MLFWMLFSVPVFAACCIFATVMSRRRQRKITEREELRRVAIDKAWQRYDARKSTSPTTTATRRQGPVLEYGEPTGTLVDYSSSWASPFVSIPDATDCGSSSSTDTGSSCDSSFGGGDSAGGGASSDW